MNVSGKYSAILWLLLVLVLLTACGGSGSEDVVLRPPRAMLGQRMPQNQPPQNHLANKQAAYASRSFIGTSGS